MQPTGEGNTPDGRRPIQEYDCVHTIMLDDKRFAVIARSNETWCSICKLKLVNPETLRNSEENNDEPECATQNIIGVIILRLLAAHPSRSAGPHWLRLGGAAGAVPLALLKLWHTYNISEAAHSAM